MYNIGEQLYILNKHAKQLRDMRRELKDRLFMNQGRFSDVTLAELKKRKDGLIYNTDSITFRVGEEEYDIENLDRSQAIEFEQRIMKEIEDCCRDCYCYSCYSNEEEMEKDIETSQEIATNEINKAQEALDNLHQTLYDWGALCRRIYTTKNIIITTLADSIFLGIHKFPDGYRECYQIGDYTFHSSFLSVYNSSTPLLELQEIEAESKIEITPAKIDEALDNLTKLAGELQPLYNDNKYTDTPTIHDSCYCDVDNEADYEEYYKEYYEE